MPEEKCPQCGAIGKNDKEHSAAARQSDRGSLHIVDLGWKCWHCGFEWGFQLPESKKARHDEIVLDFVIQAYITAYGDIAGFSEWLDSPLSREERNVAYCLADDYAGDLGY